ncbi:NUDIX domain-containing protein [Cerasicoccus arenae]|nr:NUDIX domain-containing protein [Cerasicoccus arenae]
MYDDSGDELRVFITHPGGPYFKKKDAGHWSIPKGEPDPGEDNLLEVARREFAEEIGLTPPPIVDQRVIFWPLDTITQKGGKVVHAWAFRGKWPAGREVVSNQIEIEWPPKSGKKIFIPEVDRAEMVTVEKARRMLKAAQTPFLDRLVGLLAVQ